MELRYRSYKGSYYKIEGNPIMYSINVSQDPILVLEAILHVEIKQKDTVSPITSNRGAYSLYSD